MPPLGVQVVDTDGVALIERWIATELQTAFFNPLGANAMKRIPLEYAILAVALARHRRRRAAGTRTECGS